MSKSNNKQIDQKRCQAMRDAGIEKPTSKAGIDFCTGGCPYDYCVLFEHLVTKYQHQAKAQADIAKKLRTQGVEVNDIMLILGMSLKSVQRLLKR